ncbi:MAG: flotillin family protein [Candidatus Latescibacteria bacterium]|nr:flotillin family protein [Candidatus Latescibacterota bacterium]
MEFAKDFPVMMPVIVAVLVLFISFLVIVSRYRRCASDQVLVIYGNVGQGKSSRCIHGGAAFIWPIIQDYRFLSLRPIQINIPLENALSRQNIRVSVPSIFTIGISTDPVKVMAAAERLLGLSATEIEEIAKEIILGQLRQVVVTMDIEEINADRDKFLANISQNVEIELEKIGLRLLNVNITDIKDESGYLDALGKRAAAEAVNKARIQVAEKERDGAVGEANAKQQQRIQVAQANATAVEGENKAQVTIANSTSEMRQKKAEAERAASAAEKVQSAKALQEAYASEQAAEVARAERERATQTADIVVMTEIQKRRIEIEADAQAEKARREAIGQADATFATMEAQARGINEILTKQAQGFQRLVEAAGGDAAKAATLMIVEKLPELVATQVEAIKNLKIDKVMVWDSQTGNGQSSTANFLSSLVGSVPPLQNLFDLAGMKLPEVLGKPVEQPPAQSAPPAGAA